MGVMKMKAFKFEQFGCGEDVTPTTIYLSILTAGELAERTVIDRWSKDDRDGYQRPVSESRILKGKRSVLTYLLEQMGTFPTSVLLSVREQVIFTPESKLRENIVIGELEIPKDTKLWVIDGQHRIEGLKAAIRKDSQFKSYPVIASIIVMPERFDEMLLFHIVNNTAKSVPTDLAFKHLQSMVTKFPHIPKWIAYSLDIRDLRKGIASIIVDILADSPDSPFYKRIAYIDEEFMHPKHIIKDSLMANYIAQKILREKTFELMETGKVADLLKWYWSVIAKLYKDAFDNPADYYLTQTSGIASFTIIFPTIYAMCANRGNVSKKEMEKLLKFLQEETRKHSDPEFRRPLTSEWWSKKHAPLIAKATGEAVFKQLANRLIEKINLGLEKEEES
jgi:DGQHR domain-containing protein